LVFEVGKKKKKPDHRRESGGHCQSKKRAVAFANRRIGTIPTSGWVEKKE